MKKETDYFEHATSLVRLQAELVEIKKALETERKLNSKIMERRELLEKELAAAIERNRPYGGNL